MSVTEHIDIGMCIGVWAGIAGKASISAGSVFISGPYHNTIVGLPFLPAANGSSDIEFYKTSGPAYVDSHIVQCFLFSITTIQVKVWLGPWNTSFSDSAGGLIFFPVLGHLVYFKIARDEGDLLDRLVASFVWIDIV